MSFHRLKTLAWASALTFILALAPARADQNSTCLPTTGVVSGLQFANLSNAGLKSIVSTFSGSTAPVTDCLGVTLPGQLWWNTAGSQYKPLTLFDGTSPVAFTTVDATNHQNVPPIGGGSPPSIASAATVDLGSVPHAYVIITGSTGPITSFGSTATIGQIKYLRFASTPSVTHNATSLILPNGGNGISANAGDVWAVVYEGGGNWRVVNVQTASGAPLSAELPCTEKDYKGITPPAGYFVEDGSAFLSASYPALASCLSTQLSSGTVNGSTTISGISSTATLRAGYSVCGPGVASGTKIATVAGGNSITITIAATLTATNTLVFAPWGCSGTTTLYLPDMRGRVSAGADDQGSNGAAGRITSGGANCSGFLGAGCGAQTYTIVTANLPPYTPSGTVASSGSFNIGWNTGVGFNSGGPFAAYGHNLSPNVSDSFSVSSSGSLAGVAQGGLSTPFAILPPMAFGYKIIKY